jgi:hypothetical protein
MEHIIGKGEKRVIVSAATGSILSELEACFLVGHRGALIPISDRILSQPHRSSGFGCLPIPQKGAEGYGAV